MRFALIVVAAAWAGVGLVLFSTGPSGSPTFAPSAPKVDGPPPDTVAIVPVIGTCPPCQSAPFSPGAWSQALTEASADSSVDRAAALSLALADGRQIREGLGAEDPAVRELAALLLNVTSGKVAGCTPIRGGGKRVSAVLDRLDRLLSRVHAGEPIPAGDLAAASAAAAALNRGEGLPAGCGGDSH